MTSAAPFRFKLDASSGLPVYRQLIDQVTWGIASGVLVAGAQLPTVRSVSVDLAINPNTVLRAYRELEIRGVLDTQQGTGTFVADKPAVSDAAERTRRLEQLLSEIAARAGEGGFSLEDVMEGLRERMPDQNTRRK